MEVIKVENVSYVYQSKYQKVQALKNVSCFFESGKFYAIIGHSGSGKTTLLSLLAGLSTPTEGQISVYGKALDKLDLVRHRRTNVSVIFQSYNLFPALTVIENVLYPVMISKKVKRDDREHAAAILKSVGITEDKFWKKPAMLSGGEQQRVAIARSLISSARIILADEPTGNLDTENGEIVIDKLKHLVNHNGYCVIVVTHDLGIAAQADVVYQMKDGHILEIENI